MSISTELIFSLIINLLSVGVFVGTYITTISFMKEQIKDLKEEMRKYNNVLSRLAVAENSIKSAHNRIDEIVDENR